VGEDYIFRHPRVRERGDDEIYNPLPLRDGFTALKPSQSVKPAKLFAIHHY
jgi:hypothetical protein